MIEIDEKEFKISDGEFSERMAPVMEEMGECILGKKAYDFFVKELMTALDNTAKNAEGLAWNVALFGNNIFAYHRLKGKADAFNEIHERVAKEYGLAYNYSLRTTHEAENPDYEIQKRIHDYIDRITENVLPRDGVRCRREDELLRRKFSMAMADAMYEAFIMGRAYSDIKKNRKQGGIK